MKHALCKIKDAFISLFNYPTRRLRHASVDYDAYWVDKRGVGLGKLSHWQRLRADIALSYIDHTRSVSLADIGCGDGSVLSYIKDKTQVGRIIGVDISSTALIKARAQGVETILVGKDLLESVDVVPEVDYFILFEILEHIPNSEDLLAAALERSRNGVFCSFPNTGYILHRLRVLFGRFPLQWRLHPSEHLRFWTYTDLKWWLEALGYKNYKIHTYEGVPVLDRLWPSLFGAALFVYLPKPQVKK